MDDRRTTVLMRRSFLIASRTVLAGLAASSLTRRFPVRAEAASKGTPKQVKIVDFTDSGERKEVALAPVIQMADAE